MKSKREKILKHIWPQNYLNKCNSREMKYDKIRPNLRFDDLKCEKERKIKRKENNTKLKMN